MMFFGFYANINQASNGYWIQGPIQSMRPNRATSSQPTNITPTSTSAVPVIPSFLNGLSNGYFGYYRYAFHLRSFRNYSYLHKTLNR